MVIWDISPEIFSLGPLSIRWYGLLFASSFFIGFYIMESIFKKEGKSEDDLNDLVWYMIIGTVAGARIGHCLFYNPEYYLSNPLEILKVWKGGLASHGAAVGILLSIFYYVKKHPKIPSFTWMMDRVVITVALAAFFIRTGNLFNSEIYGRATDVAWSFVFVSVDSIPRHPTQIYEAVAYLLIFFLLYSLYKKHGPSIETGLLFGTFLVSIFGFRFFVEFYKANQTYFEEGMSLNMGQLLSIPLILYGAYLLYNVYFRNKNSNGDS